jgi:hypothetical protein
MNDSTDKKLFINVDGSGFSVITNKNIHNGQFTLEESICSESELRFGGCESSKIQFKMNNVTSSLKDMWLTVNQVVDGHSENPLQLGVFKVFSDKLTADRRHKEIIAYDRMYDIVNTDITDWYNGLVFPMTIGKLRDLLFKELEVKQQDTVLINDNSFVDKSSYSSKVSAGDLLKDICELNACFGKMDRNDVFSYVSLINISVETKEKRDYSEVQYEDFQTKHIDRLLISQNSADSDFYYGEGSNTYTISTRILQINDDELQPLCENIYENIKDIVYTPSNIECRGNPCIECGDMITFVSGNGIEVTTYILERKLSGINFLKDTYLSNGTEYYLDFDSSNSKVYNSINNSISEVYRNTIYSITLTNSELFEISNKEQQILKYNLAATSDTEIISILTIPFVSDLDGVIVLNYYADAELLSSQTIRKYFERGDNVLTVCNYIPLAKNARITLTISLKSEYFESDKRISDSKIISLENYVKNGSYSLVDVDTTIPKLTIQQESVRWVVIGKGMVMAEAKWDGTINLADSFGTIKLDNMPIVSFSDNLIVSKLIPTASQISESFGFISPTVSIVGIRDNMIVNEVVDNYTFNTEKASFYDYDSERVTTDGVFALNTAYSDPQTVTSNAISLAHSSILGIESATAICTGTLSMAISTDYKVTWKAHNGTEWLTLSDDYSGMSKEQLEAITVDQWNEIIQDVDAIYIRIALTDTTQSVEEIIINFAN